MLALIFLASLLFAGLPACSQDPADVPHARDFGAREMISSIFISPLPDAPFHATVTTAQRSRVEIAGSWFATVRGEFIKSAAD
jgi:hypothetical protein